jgi:hypothetical protein
LWPITIHITRTSLGNNSFQDSRGFQNQALNQKICGDAYKISY